MRPVHNRKVQIRSTFPAAPRNSPPHTALQRAATGHEFPVLRGPCRSRFRRESKPWNRLAPRAPPFQKRAAFLPCARSSAQTALRSSAAAAANRFLFRASIALKDSQRAAAILRARILSPNSPPRRLAALPPRFSPCPTRRPSAREFRCPIRASTARKRPHLVRATPRPAKPNPAARGSTLPVLLP